MKGSQRKQRAHTRQVERRSRKQRASFKAEVKRQRTRTQTPALWKARKKGRPVQMNPFRGWHTIRPILPLAA